VRKKKSAKKKKPVAAHRWDECHQCKERFNWRSAGVVNGAGDVFCGVGGYLCNVGRTVLSGAGKIVTAPFKADFIVPRVRRYRYVPGHIYREPADTLYDTPVDPYPPYAGPFPTQHLPSIPRHGGG